jgi:hypothetical protein
MDLLHFNFAVWNSKVKKQKDSSSYYPIRFFLGTYCQQREVEAITEDIDKNRGLCCCEAGRFPHMLSLNAAFTQRWLAWEVICLKFVVDGYSIKENKFNETVVGYDLRKRLISLMIKVNIFFVFHKFDIRRVGCYFLCDSFGSIDSLA